MPAVLLPDRAGTLRVQFRPSTSYFLKSAVAAADTVIAITTTIKIAIKAVAEAAKAKAKTHVVISQEKDLIDAMKTNNLLRIFQQQPTRIST